MSKTLRISYVVEGATDYIVLDALVELFLGAVDYVPTQIQPPNPNTQITPVRLAAAGKGS